MNSHTLIQNGKILVVFPAEISILDMTLAQNSFKIIQNIESTATATITSNSSNLTIVSGFQTLSLPPGSVIQFSISNIVNPVSLQPTSSFQIYTMTSSNSVVDGAFVNLNLQMQSVDPLSSIAILPSSLINDAITTYLFSLNFSSLIASAPLHTGDLISVMIPSSIGIPTSPTC